MIRVNNVSKSFGDFKALDNLTMTVPKAAIYGLVGPNGAGKSTILRNITGILVPDSGEITIDGQKVYENPAIKNKFAYIPDDFFYFNTATPVDMKEFYRQLYPKFDELIFSKLLEAFPEINPKGVIRSMSKGMQKQVAFLLAISTRPEVLILDEPVDGLDPVMRKQIWSILMSDVAEHELTVLVSSHNLRELEDVCDHVGIMDHGSIMIERSLDELQGSIIKLQVAFEGDMPALPKDVTVLHQSTIGRVSTLIIKGNQQAAKEAVRSLNPLIMDELPLSLEEIFIYELGGVNYAVKDIIF